jgi:hypothetical protein
MILTVLPTPYIGHNEISNIDTQGRRKKDDHQRIPSVAEAIPS